MLVQEACNIIDLGVYRYPAVLGVIMYLKLLDTQGGKIPERHFCGKILERKLFGEAPVALQNCKFVKRN